MMSMKHSTTYNYEIYGPGVRGLGPMAGQIWTYSKNESNLRKSSFLDLFPQKWKINRMHDYEVHIKLST